MRSAGTRQDRCRAIFVGRRRSFFAGTAIWFPDRGRLLRPHAGEDGCANATATNADVFVVQQAT